MVFDGLLAGFQLAASGSAGIAAASQSASDLCGTGVFRVGFFGVRTSGCVCVFFLEYIDKL